VGGRETSVNDPNGRTIEMAKAAKKAAKKAPAKKAAKKKK
jgi:hypothetical protein